MTRFPEMGTVKTRLEPALGATRALELHSELARYCIRRMYASALGGTVELEVHVSGGSPAKVRRWLGRRVAVRAQTGTNLGERLASAAQTAIREGAPAVLLVGSDAPDLGGSHVRSALLLLAEPGCDVVLGPATDGGYCLIGMNADAASRAIPAMFAPDVPWGSPRVLDHSLAAARVEGLHVELLEPLSDIDRPEDLAIWERVLTREAAARAHPRLSVVIPALNEECEIEAAVRSSFEAGATEVIVADGGSTDGTASRARGQGATVAEAPIGRARQLNAGAELATGDVLLFLHADSRLPSDARAQVRGALAVNDFSLGSFGFRAGDPARFMDRLITAFGRLRHRIFRLPYGDQAPFIKRQDFADLGGFPDMPVLEDYELALRCKQLGRLCTVDADCATSSRSWRRYGLLRVTVTNAAVIAGYRLGVSTQRLAGWRARILAPVPPPQ